MAERKVESYSNIKVLAASGLALLAAVALLVIFIVFLSISKPSYSDLNKFIFMTLIINFSLFVIYGICCFLKDDNIVSYGLKTWVCCLVAAVTIVILSIISLLKSRERRLPTACLWISIAVAAVIFLINTEFCLDDMRATPIVMSQGPSYMMASSKDKDDRLEGEKTMSDRLPTEKPERTKIEKRQEEPMVKEAPHAPSLAAERSLRKEINPPRRSAIKDYKKDTGDGAITWERTHFIVGIEAGAEMKKKWGQVMAGLQAWLQKLPDKVLISLFTFDSTFYMGPVCKSPSEMITYLKKGMEVRGGSGVSLAPALETFADIMNSPDIAKKGATGFLQYGFILLSETVKYPDAAVANFLDFKKKNGANFFFNLVTQVDNTSEMTKIATALEGVHYSIRKDFDMGRALSEALTRDPSKSS